MLFQHNSSSISSFLVSVFQVFFSVLRTISVITAFFKVHTRELQHNRPLAATFKNKADKRCVIFSREKIIAFFHSIHQRKWGWVVFFFACAQGRGRGRTRGRNMAYFICNQRVLACMYNGRLLCTTTQKDADIKNVIRKSVNRKKLRENYAYH